MHLNTKFEPLNHLTWNCIVILIIVIPKFWHTVHTRNVRLKKQTMFNDWYEQYLGYLCKHLDDDDDDVDGGGDGGDGDGGGQVCSLV